MARKIEEEKNKVSGGNQKAHRLSETAGRNPARRDKVWADKGAQSSSARVKSEVKVDVPPPGLGFGEVGQRFFGKIPRNLPTQTKLPREDTDSILTDSHTTHGKKQGDQQTQFLNAQ